MVSIISWVNASAGAVAPMRIVGFTRLDHVEGVSGTFGSRPRSSMIARGTASSLLCGSSMTRPS